MDRLPASRLLHSAKHGLHLPADVVRSSQPRGIAEENGHNQATVSTNICKQFSHLACAAPLAIAELCGQHLNRANLLLYMMQGCHTPPSPPPPHGIPPAPPVGWGLWWCPSPPRRCGFVVVAACAPPQVRLGLALFAVVPAAGDTAHDVVLKTATRVDNRIIFDLTLNIIIVVVIFIISTIKEQLPPSPSPYNPHN